MYMVNYTYIYCFARSLMLEPSDSDSPLSESLDRSESSDVSDLPSESCPAGSRASTLSESSLESPSPSNAWDGMGSGDDNRGCSCPGSDVFSKGSELPLSGGSGLPGLTLSVLSIDSRL